MVQQSKLTRSGHQNSWVRIIIAAALAAIGIAWIVVYLVVGSNQQKLPWMYDLANWNWVIGFGLFFIGLIVASNPGTPLGRGRGVLVGMLGSFLLGLAWIVLYYVAGSSGKVPLVTELGNYNLGVGIAFLAVGFVFATKWE